MNTPAKIASACALLLALGSLLWWRSHRVDPILAVVLMVKNEEAVIVPTVDRFVQGGITSFFIFDTGSTDHTIAVIEQYFKDKKITSYGISQEPFIDFSTSRNRALELAEAYFPHAGFFIMPDAEWYIVNAHKLLAFCQEQIHEKEFPIYSVRALYAGNFNDYDVDRLFRAANHIRFMGVVHETPNYAGVRIKVPRDIYFEHNPSRYGDEKTQARTKRDIALLTAEHEKEPKNGRTIFYLAQSYMVLGDFENAIRFFKKRAELKGFNEERFLALYRIAQMTEILENQQKADWQEALDYYLQAFKTRPTRAEPLIHIAHYYLCKKDFQQAFDYANQACQISYPNDSLAINKELYETTRWQVLAHAAEALGQFQISYQAACQALRYGENAELKNMCERVALQMN